MAVTRAQFAALLEPILRGIRSDEDYPRPAQLYQKLYRVATSKKAKESFFELAGLGDFSEKGEGAVISYDDPVAGNEITFTHRRRALGYKITQEMLDHDQYQKIKRLERELQIATDDDLETLGHLLLNNGFATTKPSGSSGYRATGFAGEALFSTSHTQIRDTGTLANRPSTDVNLDWTGLADGITNFMLLEDGVGRPITISPSRLWVHPNDMLTAKELLRSSGKPGTANNEINVLQGDLELVVSQYLTDTNAWFIQGNFNDDNGSLWFWDTVAGARTAMEDDFDTEVVKRKARHGESFGHADWRNWYGTNGA